MDKPFRFRRAREIAGAFVLFAAAIVIVGVILHGQIRGWFQPKEVFEVMLPETGTQGLRPGSDVYVLGNKTGTVSRVELRHADTGEALSGYTDVTPDKIRLVAILEIRGGMAVFVGQDSKAVLKRDLGGFGSSFFEVSRGHMPWSDPPRRLEFSEPGDVQDQLTATVESIHRSIIPALDSITSASTNISKLAASLDNEDGSFQQGIAGLNSLIARIDRGEGALGVLLDEEGTTKTDLSETLANVRKASDSLTVSIEGIQTLVEGLMNGEGAAGRLLADDETDAQLADAVKGLSDATTSLNTSLEAIEGGARQFPETVAKTDDVIEEIGEAVAILQQALSDIQLAAEGLQNHWLLKGSVDDVKDERAAAEAAQRRAAEQAEAARRQAAGEEEEEPKKRGFLFWRR